MKKKPSPTGSGSIERVHVRYTGRVQGVGFRHTTEALALELGLVGWVKNLRDGRVEMVCEGPRVKVELLLCRIQESSLGPHIRKADLRWEVAVGGLDDFTVEFDH